MAALTARCHHQSLHDPLTGLANRRLLCDRIEHALKQRPQHAGSGVAVLWIDLDGFKAVNAAVGHAAGDRLLMCAAECLKLLARDGDTAARVGGDEFALVLPDADIAGAVGVAERLSRALARPAPPGEGGLAPNASIGVAVSDGTQDMSALLTQAEVAMTEAKRHSPGRYQVFEGERHAAAVARQDTSAALKGVVARGELFLSYQPVMDLSADRMTGVEALVRWQHPTRGLLPPMEWIPVAEATGAINEIGAWVLREACEQLLRWDDLHPGHPLLDMAVNVSPRQLDDSDIVARLEEVLSSTGLAPHRLVIEVTETALADEPDAMIARLEQIKALGCQIAIDDFGTGFSSLSLLRRMPIDLIKIDKAFVDGIARDPQEWAFTTAIVTLAHSLGKSLVAEGIERGEQLAHLIALRCQFGQGYLFSRPVTPGEISGAMTVGDRPGTT